MPASASRAAPPVRLQLARPQAPHLGPYERLARHTPWACPRPPISRASRKHSGKARKCFPALPRLPICRRRSPIFERMRRRPCLGLISCGPPQFWDVDPQLQERVLRRVRRITPHVYSNGWRICVPKVAASGYLSEAVARGRRTCWYSHSDGHGAGAPWTVAFPPGAASAPWIPPAPERKNTQGCRSTLRRRSRSSPSTP